MKACTETYNGYFIDEANALLIDRDGNAKKLRNKTFQVLLVLARSETRLVSKDQIIREVWPDTVVTDDSLVQCIREIRRALGVSTKEVLITRARRGYELYPDCAREPPESFSQNNAQNSAQNNAQNNSASLSYRSSSRHNDTQTTIMSDPHVAGATVLSEEVIGSARNRSVGLVGRNAELNEMLRWLEQVDGQGAELFLVYGEAGIGKSELINTLRSRQEVTTQWQVCSSLCFEFGTDLAYATLANWLRTPSILDGIKLLSEQQQQTIGKILPEFSDCVPLDNSSGLESYNRLQLYEAVLAAFQGSVLPVLFVIDNLQWCDKESLAWLEFLQCRENAPSHAVLCASRMPDQSVASASGQFIQHYRACYQCCELGLRPLAAADSECLLRNLLPARFDDNDSLCLIDGAVRVARGLPLHLCEIARCAIEHSPQRVQLDLGIRHFIALRLQQLGGEHEDLLHTCVVLGSSFSAPLLAKILKLSEQQVFAALEALWQLAFIDSIDTGTYALHDLVRECIYEQLSPLCVVRRHREIAEYYQTEVARGKAACYGPLARHHQHAGNHEQAALCFRRAAEHYRQRCASHAEARELQRAIQCLEKLPASGACDKTRVELLLDLGLAWSRDTGWGSSAIGEAWREAYQLAQSIDDVVLQGRATNTYDTFLRDNGRWHECVAIGREAYGIKSRLSDPFLQQSIVSSRAALLLHTGQPRDALALYDELLHDTRRAAGVASYNWFNSSHRIGAFFRSAQCLWLLGQRQTGAQRCEQALELSARSGQPFHQAITLFHVCLFYEFDRDFERVTTYAEQLRQLSEHYRFSYYLGAANLYLAFARAHLARDAAEVKAQAATVQTLTEGQHNSGTRMFDTYWFANLAVVKLLSGNSTDAYAVARRVLRRNRVTRNTFWDSELQRLCGDAQRLSACGEDASDHYQAAIDVARQQGATGLMQRALSSVDESGPAAENVQALPRWGAG